MPSNEAPAPDQPPTNELPQLSTFTAASEDDRIDGLNLIADSVAQQRQVASKMMIFHPVNLAALGVIMAIVAQYMLRTHGDYFVFGTTAGGITMAFLIAIRWLTGGYIGLAEEVGAEWLGDDRVIVAKWGDDIIGSLVLGWADGDAAKKRGRRRRGKAIVRGWTVKLKYRGKGVGEGLLEEAVKVAGEKGADGIVFAADHASKFYHCLNLLPSCSNPNSRLSAHSPIDLQRLPRQAGSKGRKGTSQGCRRDSASHRPHGAADERFTTLRAASGFPCNNFFAFGR
jgi:predicted GNAT family acetyltransferase